MQDYEVDDAIKEQKIRDWDKRDKLVNSIKCSVNNIAVWLLELNELLGKKFDVDGVSINTCIGATGELEVYFNTNKECKINDYEICMCKLDWFIEQLPVFNSNIFKNNKKGVTNE